MNRLFDGGVQAVLSAEVKQRMAELKVRQRDVATIVGISEKHLSQLLTGRSQGTLEMWDRLFAALRDSNAA